MPPSFPSPPLCDRPRLGVSSCLMGNAVRYDATDDRHEAVTEVLGRLFELIGVCPEMELGMPAPREPIQLERHGGEVRLRGVASRIDHTEAMRRYAAGRIRQLQTLRIAGYVVKSRSPSCGLENVKVYDDLQSFTRTGRGLFAEVLTQAMPDLPVVEEKDLDDPMRLERFIRQAIDFAHVIESRRDSATWGGRS